MQTIRHMEDNGRIFSHNEISEEQKNKTRVATRNKELSHAYAHFNLLEKT